MSSFQKRKLENISIPGTKSSIQNGQKLASCGNLALDHIIGGGMCCGSIMMIEEDKFVTYSKVLTKYFLAEGVFSGHSIFLASLDDHPIELLKKLPTPTDEQYVPDDPKPPTPEEARNDMRIAWRYSGLPKVNSEQIANIGHHFDLTKQISKEELNNVEKFCWPSNVVNMERTPICPTFSNQNYYSIIDNILAMAKDPKFSITEDPKQESIDKTILRICITSLGSPLWYSENFNKDFITFLTILKSIVRDSLSLCFLTVPLNLLKTFDEHLVHQVRNMVDYSFELDSFAGSNRETNPAFKEYNGLLYIRKLGALNSLAAFSPETTDLAFKLRRRRFIIEKLHLPPELQDSEQREQDDIMPSTSCGSVKPNLEF